MARIVAIGALQGGVHALQTLVSKLPPDFDAPVLIVLHIGAEQTLLPSILTSAGRLPVSLAEDGEEIQSGYIYVAPPDRHLLVKDGKIELSHGPRENYVRPASMRFSVRWQSIMARRRSTSC